MHDDRHTDLKILDAVIHEAALVEAEQATRDPAYESWDDGVVIAIGSRLAEMRRNLVPADPPSKARPIRPSLLVLGRDALLAKLEAMTRAMGGAVQYAHRDLATLSDDDLKRMIEMLEPAPPAAE